MVTGCYDEFALAEKKSGQKQTWVEGVTTRMQALTHKSDHGYSLPRDWSGQRDELERILVDDKTVQAMAKSEERSWAL